jgi:hypothetical protein
MKDDDPDIHSCKRCGYSTKYKNALKNHLNRKKVCEPKVSDIDVSELLEELSRGFNDKTYDCEKCGKKFNNRQNRHTHLRICGVGCDVDELIKKIDEMQKQLSNMSQGNTITNHHNIQNNISITQNNQINAFGKEDTKHLSHAFLSKCVRKTNMGIIDLLEKLHFDPEANNANVRITNKKLSSLIEFNNGEKWQYARKDSVLNSMLDKGRDILENHYEYNADEIKLEVSESMFQYIAEWMEKVADKDKRTIESLLTDIYVLILNNS